MYKDYEIRLGKKIKHLREKRGFTLEQLANKLQLSGCDISVYSLSRIEHNQKHIRVFELKCLKEALNVTYEELMEN